MTRLLRIDASSRQEGSHSRAIADAFVRDWRARHPDGEVVTRDVIAEPIPHIAEATIAGFYTPPAAMTAELRAATALSDQLIAELRAADELLIATPMYNFSVPSALKAWIDHIVRIDETFAFDGTSFAGLLTGRRATVVASYGVGGYARGEPLAEANFLDTYLGFLLRFLGVELAAVIPIEATSGAPEALAANRTRALELIARAA